MFDTEYRFPRQCKCTKTKKRKCTRRLKRNKVFLAKGFSVFMQFFSENIVEIMHISKSYGFLIERDIRVSTMRLPCFVDFWQTISFWTFYTLFRTAVAALHFSDIRVGFCFSVTLWHLLNIFKSWMGQSFFKPYIMFLSCLSLYLSVNFFNLCKRDGTSRRHLVSMSRNFASHFNFIWLLHDRKEFRSKLN